MFQDYILGESLVRQKDGRDCLLHAATTHSISFYWIYPNTPDGVDDVSRYFFICRYDDSRGG